MPLQAVLLIAHGPKIYPRAVSIPQKATRFRPDDTARKSGHEYANNYPKFGVCHALLPATRGYLQIDSCWSENIGVYSHGMRKHEHLHSHNSNAVNLANRPEAIVLDKHAISILGKLEPRDTRSAPSVARTFYGHQIRSAGPRLFFEQFSESRGNELGPLRSHLEHSHAD